jgi:3-oxoadipate enol-lactonase
MPKAKVNGINLSYRVEGQGEPLLMIGGFNSNRYIWWGQVPAFKKYYRVITFDNRGAGGSDKKGPYSIPVMAKDALGLLDLLNIQRAHILGISMGGLIAQELAIHHPERVSKLILTCTYSHIDETCGPTLETLKAAELPVRHMIDAILDLTINKRLYRLTLMPLMRVKNRLADAAAIRGKLKASQTYKSDTVLWRIKASTLVITGTNDRVIKPTSSDTLAKLIPDASYVKIKNGSHIFFLEMKKHFNQTVLDFLKR